MKPQKPAKSAGNEALASLAPDRFGRREAAHLLRRAGFGGSIAQIEQLVSLGLERAVDHLVRVDAIDGYAATERASFDDSIMLPLGEAERTRLREAQRNNNEAVLAEFRVRRQQAELVDREQLRSMQAWWVKRMIETPRPLEEKMTLFWHGHFATSFRTVENSFHMYLQNQLFRRHAVGRFTDLLGGIVHDPAMLRFLNNQQNRRQRPNENLARELMELFSLGPGAYTEQDIKEGARALTGYMFEGNAFAFNAQAHDAGQKRILGRTGAFDGDDFVRIILDQPACAEFICQKLYRFFVGDAINETSRAVVEELAKLMRAEGTALQPLLRALFMSEHFYADTVVGRRIKSPAELLVGAIRSMRLAPGEADELPRAFEAMGQTLFMPPNVAGWPGERAWITTSTLFARQNTVARLIIRSEGIDAGAMTSAAQAWRRPGEDAATGLARCLLAAEPMPSEVAALRTIMGDGMPMSPRQAKDILVLLAALPSYQLC